ncbi:MAG TPA: YMGG-like glycine zipper-containing protein [Janthinobacterium sp.]|jgi:hypothetical protein|nr:YMGG-like glycine zipper-containing protein [Janthinobacterium sp.]
MRLRSSTWLALMGPALLGACTVMPSGPSALVLPGTGKSFDQFRADDFSCRNYAQVQIGGTTAQQASVDSGVRSAALGTALGAVAGAAIDGGHGAGVGAGTGLLFGSLAGADAGQASGYGLQQRYDFAYQQCMYADGHRVPVSGRMLNETLRPGTYPPPDTPPPNTPPPGELSRRPG